MKQLPALRLILENNIMIGFGFSSGVNNNNI